MIEWPEESINSILCLVLESDKGFYDDEDEDFVMELCASIEETVAKLPNLKLFGSDSEKFKRLSLPSDISLIINENQVELEEFCYDIAGLKYE